MTAFRCAGRIRPKVNQPIESSNAGCVIFQAERSPSTDPAKSQKMAELKSRRTGTRAEASISARSREESVSGTFAGWMERCWLISPRRKQCANASPHLYGAFVGIRIFLHLLQRTSSKFKTSSGCRQRRPGKQANPRSSVIHSQPCSSQRAAWQAAGIRLPRASTLRQRPVKISGAQIRAEKMDLLSGAKIFDKFQRPPLLEQPPRLSGLQIPLWKRNSPLAPV